MAIRKVNMIMAPPIFMTEEIEDVDDSVNLQKESLTLEERMDKLEERFDKFAEIVKGKVAENKRRAWSKGIDYGNPKEVIPIILISLVVLGIVFFVSMDMMWILG